MRLQTFRRRLLVRLTALALIAMLLASIVQVLLITREQRQDYVLLQSQLTSTQIPLLQTALWDIEISALQRQLIQIVELRSVAAVRLHAETGLQLQAGEATVAGAEADSVLVIHSPSGDGRQLGELQVFYRHDLINQRIINSILQRVLEFSLYTLLLFFVLFRALHKEVGRPLQVIADYVGSLKPQKQAPRLFLSREQRDWYDEIDLIARGFDTLRQGMSHYAEQHECAIEALANERDSLDRRVDERTAELAYLNGYLKLISGSSLKLMHLDHAQYPQAMRQRLRALGQYLQLDAGVLLDTHVKGSNKVRVSWMKEDDNHWLDQTSNINLWAGQMGWSVSQHDSRTWLIRFINPQRSFCYIVRSRHGDSQFTPEREELLLGAGQWLFSLVQHWDHVVGLEQARQELVQLSWTDPLTGLANRRRFEEHRIGELRRAMRLGYPVSLLMIDVDYFKGFNDLYGHAAGDECLQSLARLLDASFKRTGELPARIGGEEFAVLLPGYDLDSAGEAADSLRRAVQGLGVHHEGSIWGQVTVSIGCASWDGPGEVDEVIDGLMKTADAVLYEAKRLGRNRVALRVESVLSDEQ